MQLQEKNRIKLERQLKDNGFEHAINYLMETTRQGVRCAKAGETDYIKPGRSRVGGDPDLPPQFAWPLTSDGTPMTFLAQLNMCDVAKHDVNELLPKTGMLSFFLGIDEPAYNIEHRVIWFDETEVLTAVRREPSGETALEDTYVGYDLEARPSLEPPGYAYVDMEQVENDEVTFGEYDDLFYEIRDQKDGDIIQLFGYPTEQHDDSEYEAALMILTGKEYEYSMDKALDEITAHFGGDKTKAKQEVTDMQMLLELETDDDVGFCWWDAGVLHFFIRKEDLIAGRFDRTYCSLYSS
ncbi:YwqG family protein [Bacillus sp. FJAT-52991]|uniref:YwqG family protein n=1 Tax=Bacillus kandeliae TaxID=3129297 RepID=A0ABZ2N2Y2_9BACI